MSIQRYAPYIMVDSVEGKRPFAELGPNDTGPAVLHEDYVTLKTSHEALVEALKGAEHLCKWLLQSDLSNSDRERVTRENGVDFAMALANARKLVT